MKNSDMKEFIQQEQQASGSTLPKVDGVSTIEGNNTKTKKTKIDIKLRRMGLVFMGIVLFGIVLTSTLHSSSTVDTSDAAQEAIERQVSDELQIGVRLLSEDESMTAQDYTITHSQVSDSTKIWIWDYAAEDGDYVQVLVDGFAQGEPFMIKNKPVELDIPATGEVQILGTRDGGGGITYAINYELNGNTYFNGTDVGAGNLYTLVRE